ncbi:hypothetical protein CCR95_02995 [Thiocystis minor]|nr:hypothetical protein [Thiocystis minor]
MFREFGHEVRLIAPPFVKPFVKSNKNDAVDAEAIGEAVQRPNRRFVAVKTVEPQDIQAIHRMRSLTVERRTAQVNLGRGLLLEDGIEIPQGRAALMRRLPEILEAAENGLSERFRAELNRLLEELRHLDAQVAHDDTQLQVIAQRDETAQRLMTIPGIGALIATALLAAIGNDPSRRCRIDGCNGAFCPTTIFLLHRGAGHRWEPAERHGSQPKRSGMP